jgi:hypothetical protein
VSWRVLGTGKPVQLNRPDDEGAQWKLRTLRDLLSAYAKHAISEMLAPDGSPCGPYTRGVLKRRPVRDGPRWLVLKEAAVYGDDPRHAFSVPPTEAVQRPTRTDQSSDAETWERIIRPALTVVGSVAVARRMGLAPRTARAWAAGARRPENPGKVAQAIVAVASEAGLGLPTNQHLRAKEICGELPCRAAAVQCFIVIAVEMLAECHAGVRALARAMAGKDDRNYEPTVRRWLSLDPREPRSIVDLNRIVARLSKFSRAEIKKARRRIRTEAGPVGDRQAVLAHVSLLYGSEKPLVPTPEETIALPVAILAVGFLASLMRQFAGRVAAG